ncbi:MAG TPA: PH domain-containing protein [Candidatus Saccharimonadales bacterium]
MISLDQVEDQLKRVGCNFRFWNRPEIKELRSILVSGEVIAQATNGRYENGFALLVATNLRLLLIDKKPMFLALEDIRFDMISEMDYSGQVLEGTVRIMTPNRKLVFSSWNQGRLRIILNYAQQRVTELRQHFIEQQFYQTQRRDNHYAVPAVGSIALQTSRRGQFNPYTNMPLTMRRRRIPKFY